jgi:glutaryl-CoA dehydrogenase
MLDFYRVEELLSGEERRVRDTARRFVKDEVLPVIWEHYNAGTFPIHLVQRLGASGLLASLADPPSATGYGLVMQELERGDSALRSFASVQLGLVANAIKTFGSEAHKQAWLPALTSGEKIGCFGLTDPRGGSDPAAMTMTATRVADGYRLKGIKQWITNAGIAHVAVVWARLDGTIRGFLVEREREAFIQRPPEGQKHSLRASATGSLHFDDCFIPEENLLPGSDGLQSALVCLNRARFGIAWGVIGAAQACYESALRFAEGRELFGRRLAGFQLSHEKLAQMVADITHMQLLARRLAELVDAGTARPADISLAKWQNVDKACTVASTALGMLGAVGIYDAFPVIRHHANLIGAVATYEGTPEIHKLVIGQAVTGLKAFT